jgi:hypothetical protein
MRQDRSKIARDAVGPRFSVVNAEFPNRYFLLGAEGLGVA